MGIKKIDFSDFAKSLAGDNKLKKVFYYTARMDNDFDEERYTKHQKFLNKFSSTPNFKVVYCTFKKIIERNDKISYAVK